MALVKSDLERIVGIYSRNGLPFMKESRYGYDTEQHGRGSRSGRVGADRV